MAGLATLRQGTVPDAVDGVIPRQVVEPETPEAFAETLARASSERLQTVIRGGGTKLGWGRAPATVDLLVRTSKLNRLLAHRYGDLTATVQAGMPLAALNRELRAHGQWLPIDSAFEDATVGGLLATNEAGPSRHRNGTPRDLLIGITLALTDGRLVKAGGTVVKNVAGYDLGKLMAGSHGSLAGIVDLTFKLVPLPQASATLVAGYTDAATLARDVDALAASQLEPAAFDVRADISGAGGDTRPFALIARVASSPAATQAQVQAASAMMSARTGLFEGEAEARLWADQIGAPWDGDHAVVRFSWLPAALPAVLAAVDSVQRITGAPATLVARAAGTGLLNIGGDATTQAKAVAALRATREIGHVVVLRASPELKHAADVWGPARDSDRAVLAIKKMFDPQGILNAGRGPV